MTNATSEKMQRYRNIFNDLDDDWVAIVDHRDTEKEAAFIEGALKRKGRTILDLCCGTGRHSLILSQRGWEVIGLDLSKNLLAIAQQKMKQKATEFPLVRADMRCIPFRNHVFNAVVNMFTSFGYLPSEKEDMKSLNEVRRILQESGHFLLDVINKEYVMETFKEREWAEFPPFYLLEKRSLDLKESMLLSEWTIIKKNNKKIRYIQHNLRLYGFQNFKQMLNRAGLAIKQVYGGYDKKKFNPDASRMILLVQKQDNQTKRK